MHPNEPGLEESEELEANGTVESSSEPANAAETSTNANAEQPADTEPNAPAETTAETSTNADDEQPADIEQNAPAETTAETAPTPGAPAGGDSPTLKRGDLIEGTILTTSPTLVTVDVGGGKEGVIPGHELERMNRRMLEGLKPGEKIDTYVVNPHDHQGNLVLSVNRALEEIDWKHAEEYRQSQEAYESRIAGYNKGGLIVRFGRLRGFVPQSQMSMERRRALTGDTPEDRWGSMVNEVIIVKVMEVDRARNRLILSERFASRQSREKRKETLIKDLEVGEVREGRVVSLEDFGAFVDIGGAEGLVHLTEMSWQHVTHPRELLQPGQTVRVEVISIDPENKRIGLSMKRQAADPWDTIAIDYQIGQLVRGTVTKLTKFGAFAQLVDVPEIEGLIHISELSDQRVTHPREVVNEGDTLTLRVVKIDIKDRRLGLSLKKVNSAEYLDLDWSTSMGESSTPEADEADTSVNGPESTAEAEGPVGDVSATADIPNEAPAEKAETTAEAEGPVSSDATDEVADDMPEIVSGDTADDVPEDVPDGEAAEDAPEDDEKQA